MPTVKDRFREVELDFERLHETSMLWAGNNWEEQRTRFTDGEPDFSHKVIYWFERYADLMAAKSLLIEDYSIMYDLALDQWVLTTNYATESWR